MGRWTKGGSLAYETTERRPNRFRVRPKEAFSAVGLIFSPPANYIEEIEQEDEPEPEPELEDQQGVTAFALHAHIQFLRRRLDARKDL